MRTSISRLARLLTATALAVSLVPVDFVGAAQMSPRCEDEPGTELTIVTQTTYKDSDGSWWVDGIVRNDSETALGRATVRVSVDAVDETGDEGDTADVESEDVPIDTRVLAPGESGTFHAPVCDDAAEGATVEAVSAQGFATDAQPIALEVSSVTLVDEQVDDPTIDDPADDPADDPSEDATDEVDPVDPLAESVELACADDDSDGDVDEEDSWFGRVYSVELLNTSEKPVADVRLWGTEFQGAGDADSALLDTLNGESCDRIEPGETVTVECVALAAADDDDSTGIVAAVYADALVAPTVTLSFDTAAPAYGAPVAYRIEVTGPDGEPLDGPLALAASKHEDDWHFHCAELVDGVATGTVTPKRKTTFKAVYWGGDEYAQADSDEFVVEPVAEVTTPSIKAKHVKRNHALKANGRMKPERAAGSHIVKLQCFHKEGDAWVLRKTVQTTAGAAPGSYGAYAATLKLSKKGAWRVRAFHPADEITRADTSGYDYVRVR